MTPSTHPLAVITGAGSGVGQAVALALAQRAWRLVLLGRHEKTLRDTIHLAGDRGNQLTAIPCDVADPDSVRTMAGQVLGDLGPVEALVNCAGTNVPDRALSQLSFEDYQKILSVNLTGTYLCCQAFLPDMRQRGHGTIVNIVSDAGLRANAKAGPAYVASKFAQRGLTQSINAEERAHGIRACAIFPGDIDTPLL
jgi:NAD(P)-dependent dehydrogenase (short-subunit alcohol dehydrogenase family)